MTRPIVNLADIELVPRPAANKPPGASAKLYVGRQGQGLDYWDGE